MDLLSISTATLWVDFFFMAISKVYQMTKSLDIWYAKFGLVAVLSDCLVIILGILLAQFISPRASVSMLALTAVIVQVVHDYLFYIGVILPIPVGHNAVIDLFKRYASEGSYQIIIADSLMISSATFLSGYLQTLSKDVVTFIGLLGAYAMTFLLYTR
jgi:hypothetical protein